MRIAAFNLENLFARQRVFNTAKWEAGRPVLDAYAAVNTLMSHGNYTELRKQQMVEQLLALDIYFKNDQGATRARRTSNPQWAWLRRNKGKFHTSPRDASKNVRIDATGRNDWIGWVDLATEPVNEIGTRMTAQVVRDVDADIIAVVEAEDRPSLLRFNEELIDGMYEHVMLVDGNDERGIDVGIMTKAGLPIKSVTSNVDTADPETGHPLFSRDCPQYTIAYGSNQGDQLHILVNHFKSQSGGGGPKRLRQSQEVKRIAQELIDSGHDTVVLGDFNEGPPTENEPPEHLVPLFDAESPLVDTYSLTEVFDTGPRPGTFDTCSIRNRLDYILISPGLTDRVTAGGVFRKGLWGQRKTRPTAWDTYLEMTGKANQASDHAAVWIDLDL